MTNLRKITEEELKDYVSDVGEREKEHRKYSSFYLTCTHTIKELDITELEYENDVDASDFLNVCVTLNGMWDDSNGTEWDSIDYCKVEEYEELVPEKIIPEHTVIKTRSTPFVPVLE